MVDITNTTPIYTVRILVLSPLNQWVRGSSPRWITFNTIFHCQSPLSIREHNDPVADLKLHAGRFLRVDVHAK